MSGHTCVPSKPERAPKLVLNHVSPGPCPQYWSTVPWQVNAGEDRGELRQKRRVVIRGLNGLREVLDRPRLRLVEPTLRGGGAVASDLLDRGVVRQAAARGSDAQPGLAVGDQVVGGEVPS